MKSEHIKCIFEIWKNESIKKGITAEEMYDSLMEESYSQDAAKYFLELSERITSTHLNDTGIT